VLAAELVTAPAELVGVVAELLDRVVVVDDLDAAATAVKAGFKAVTRDGDLVGARWAHGGSARSRSLLDVRAAADEAAVKLAQAEAAGEQVRAELAEAADAEEAAKRVVDEKLGQLQTTDAAAAEISGRLGRLAGAARAARDEADRLEASIGAARRAAEKDLTKLATIRRELADAEASSIVIEDEPAGEESGEREAMRQKCTAARNAEMEARLEVRTVEERLRAIGGRADSLSAAATAEREARARAAQRRKQRASQATVARSVAAGARAAATAAEDSLTAAQNRRAEAELASKEGSASLKLARERVATLAAELDKVVNTAHGTEIARAEHRMRLEQLAESASEDYGVTADVLVAEYGPDAGVPVPDEAPASAVPASIADALKAVTDAVRAQSDQAPASDEGPGQIRLIPYIREEQEKRAAEADRQLTKLGKVNPLALEEYAALQERHQFLSTQLEDLRKTRRDLLTVVKEVDDRVQEVFTSAYADTAREFEGLFARLFPGGSGRLLLTEPDDMLSTGIEIEARPPGKKVKRLSLLSGGERSLTAVAYLFAIFKARPSPFYVLDEVEAALDDTNLQRLLHVFEELRENSQLIVITHQRRTMEAADALYGVTMRGDGVSNVISQRVRVPS
jgi:chromosome segregation protein